MCGRVVFVLGLIGMVIYLYTLPIISKTQNYDWQNGIRNGEASRPGPGGGNRARSGKRGGKNASKRKGATQAKASKEAEGGQTTKGESVKEKKIYMSATMKQGKKKRVKRIVLAALKKKKKKRQQDGGKI